MKQYDNKFNVLIDYKDIGRPGKKISKAKRELSKLRKKELVKILINILYFKINDDIDYNEIVHYITNLYTLDNISLFDNIYKDR